MQSRLKRLVRRQSVLACKAAQISSGDPLTTMDAAAGWQCFVKPALPGRPCPDQVGQTLSEATAACAQPWRRRKMRFEGSRRSPTLPASFRRFAKHAV